MARAATDSRALRACVILLVGGILGVQFDAREQSPAPVGTPPVQLSYLFQTEGCRGPEHSTAVRRVYTQSLGRWRHDYLGQVPREPQPNRPLAREGYDGSARYLDAGGRIDRREPQAGASPLPSGQFAKLAFSPSRRQEILLTWETVGTEIALDRLVRLFRQVGYHDGASPCPRSTELHRDEQTVATVGLDVETGIPLSYRVEEESTGRVLLEYEVHRVLWTAPTADEFYRLD